MQYPTTITGWAIWIVTVGAIVALIYLALNQFGIMVPAWIVTAFWIVVIAVVIIALIKFVAGMGSGPNPPSV